ncbi:hypothetical protein [Luteimonas flava]|uniref:hypothetical protein n=1 Tax=Luteimonas flava TaxID=3115822 RepID=UPI003CCCF705
MSAVMEEEIKRWTTRRKSALALMLEIIQGNDGGESDRVSRPVRRRRAECAGRGDPPQSAAAEGAGQ